MDEQRPESDQSGGWVSGSCRGGPDRNVTPERDDERPVEREMWGGATHFHVVLNERTYGSGRPRGTAWD